MQELELMSQLEGNNEDYFTMLFKNVFISLIIIILLFFALNCSMSVLLLNFEQK